MKVRARILGPVSPSRKSKPAKGLKRVHVLALLLPVAALAFCPVLFADFIRLDDYGHLFDNPQLRRMSVSGLATLWTKSYFNLYIPVTYSAWWAITMLGSFLGELRENAWLFHAVNLATHVANVALVFFLIRQFIRPGNENTRPNYDATDNIIAGLCAGLFAIHPIQVESVAWVSELKGELAALFGFLGMLAHFRWNRRFAALILFTVAMLSKPSAIVFPAVVFLVERIVYRKSLTQSAAAPALYFIPLTALAVVTKQLQPNSDLDFIPTFAQRLLVAADTLTFYVSKLLFPQPLAIDYGRTPELVLTQVSRLWLAFSALLLAAAVALACRAIIRVQPTSSRAHSGALALCGWALFLVAIAPVLGLVPFGFQDISTVADHYLYVPLFGISLIGAGVLVRLRGSPNARPLALGVLVVFAALTVQQARLWRSTFVLFSHTVKVTPNSYVGCFSIGDDLMRSGQLGPAIEWLKRSYAIKPENLNSALTLGMVFTQTGAPNQAVDLYTEVLGKNPKITGSRAKYVASIHNNLGMLFLQAGQNELGVNHLKKAVEIFPRALNAHLNLGNVAFAEGRYADAAIEYETALSLSPGSHGIEQRLQAARMRAR